MRVPPPFVLGRPTMQSTGMSADPLISVVIASYNARETIRLCLRSVLDQDLEAGFEVVVVDSSNDGTAELIRDEFPRICLLHMEGRTSAGEARNVGEAKVTAPFVAFTDADCIVPRDWLSRMLERHHDGDYSAVGGSICNGTPDSSIGSAEHLFAFNEFLPHNPERLVTNLPTCNVCYRKSALADARFEGGPKGAYLQAEDLILNWVLARRGEKLLFDPEIRVVHLNRTRLMLSLRHQHVLGQSSCWARKRTDLPGRLFLNFPVLVPVLPVLRLIRIGVRLSKIDRGETLRFVKLSPLIFLQAGAWAAGFMREAIRR